MKQPVSARAAPAWWQLAILPACLLAPALALWFGRADGLLWCGVALAAAMAATVLARLAAVTAGLGAGRGAPASALPEDRLPSYSVLVPLYHEAAVVPHLLAALAELRWPRDRFEALLLVEEDDADTRAALAAATLPDGVRVAVVPDGQPRTKPRACNHGLALASGELLVVFDAEDRPDPDQLLRAAAAFAALPARTACLQARLMADRRGRGLAALGFAIDYAAWFDLYLPGLHALRAPIPLGGTSNHFRTAMLRAVGGWDAWNVTEDADLGVRLARAGLDTAVLDSTTWEEAPSRWSTWLPQRSRWMKGWWQTALAHTRQPLALLRDLGPWRSAWWLATIPGQVLAALALPGCWLLLGTGLVLGWPLADAARPWTGALLVAAAALLLANALFIALTALASWRRGRRLGALLAPLLPIYWLAVSVAAWRGVLQFHRDPYRWEKTPHGEGATAPVPVPAAGRQEAAAAPRPLGDGPAAEAPSPSPGKRWRLAVAGVLVLCLALIAILATAAPRWSGFLLEVARQRIDPAATPDARAALAPDVDWTGYERVQAEIRLDAPAPSDLPLRLTFSLSVLDGTWFQHEADCVVPAGATAVLAAVPLDRGWSDPLGAAAWDPAWLRRVRDAGVRVWQPRGDGAMALEVALSPDGARPTAPLAIADLRLPQGAAVRRMSELRFRLARAYANPFDPEVIEAWAEIRSPDGTVRRAEAFAMQDYDRRMHDGSELLAPRGAPDWAVRFTPAAAGEHLISLHARDAAGTAATPPAACAVAPGDGPGFVRTAGRWFVREDGSFLYPIPLNLRGPRDNVLLNQVPQPEDRAGTEPYAEWLARCGAAGINMVRPWLAPGFLGLEWNRGWRGYHGRGQYNLENAWRIDRILALAAANRVLVELALWQHGPWERPGGADSQWVDNPYRRQAGGPIDDPALGPFDPVVRRGHRQMARYAAARWGADPALFGWTLWIEIDAVTRRTTWSWHDDIARELLQRSWGRQAASGEFRWDECDPKVWDLPSIGYTQISAYNTRRIKSTLEVLPGQVRWLKPWDKPGFIEEYGGHAWGNPPRDLAIDLHDGLWAGWSLDFAAAPMPWWWNFIFHHRLERWHRRFADYIAGTDLRGTAWRTGDCRLASGARAFYRIGPDRAWAWLRPSSAMPDAFDPLAEDPGVWFPADPARTVDLRPLGLAPGRWRVEVWDTWTAQPPTVHELVVGDGAVSLPLPTTVRDVALRFVRLADGG